MLEMRKLFLLSVAGVLSLALVPACFAANLVLNGDFGTNLNNWTMLHTVTDDMAVLEAFSGAVGNPAGSVKLERAVTIPGVATNGHRFYQFIPVDPNTSYAVYGQWKGDLSAGAQGSNWAEVFIGFTADANASQPNWGQSLRYRKSWDGVNNLNVAATGLWDWENFATSPQGTPPTAFTAQAGQNFMVVAFNLGGNILTPSTAQPYVYIDNIVVIACTGSLAGDANQDCQVNFKDLAIMTSQWLLCNLDPANSCWQ